MENQLPSQNSAGPAPVDPPLPPQQPNQPGLGSPVAPPPAQSAQPPAYPTAPAPAPAPAAPNPVPGATQPVAPQSAPEPQPKAAQEALAQANLRARQLGDSMQASFKTSMAAGDSKYYFLAFLIYLCGGFLLSVGLVFSVYYPALLGMLVMMVGYVFSSYYSLLLARKHDALALPQGGQKTVPLLVASRLVKGIGMLVLVGALSTVVSIWFALVNAVSVRSMFSALNSTENLIGMASLAVLLLGIGGLLSLLAGLRQSKNFHKLGL